MKLTHDQITLVIWLSFIAVCVVAAEFGNWREK